MADMFEEAGYQKTGYQRNSFNDIYHWFKKTWRIKGIKPESEQKFITSDNPSTIFHHPKSGKPILIYLPIHPNISATAYDVRHIKLKSHKVNDDTIGLLNALQINRCVKHVYADHDIMADDADNKDKIKEILKMEKPTRFVDNSGNWNRDFISTASPFFERLNFVDQYTATHPDIKKAVTEVINKRRT